MPSWQQFKCPCETRTDADCAEIATISRQHSVDLPPFGDGDHRPIDQAYVEVLESGVELKSSDNVRGERQLIFITCPWVEHLSDQLAHSCSVLSKKIVDFREDEPWHDDEARGDQHRFVFRKAWSPVSRAGERSEEPPGVSNDWRNQPSASRNSSDSFPSFVSVDSKRRVDGGRRPV